MTYGPGEILSLDQLKQLADEGKCFYLEFESYDPSDYQYSGPANLSSIDGDDEDCYFINEAPNGIPVKQTSFSIGDWYFSEAKSNSAEDFWDEGELHMYELIENPDG